MKSYDEISKELDIYNDTIFKILDKDMEIRRIIFEKPTNIKEFLLNNLREYLSTQLETLSKISEANINYNGFKISYEKNLMLYNEIIKGDE